MGFRRPAALEFSFLLSIPTMVARDWLDLLKEIHPSKSAVAAGLAPHVVMTSERWIVLLIGLVVSFIVALGVVEWFLQWVRKHGFVLFALYRIALGGAFADLGHEAAGELRTETSERHVAMKKFSFRHFVNSFASRSSYFCGSWLWVSTFDSIAREYRVYLAVSRVTAAPGLSMDWFGVGLDLFISVTWIVATWFRFYISGSHWWIAMAGTVFMISLGGLAFIIQVPLFVSCLVAIAACILLCIPKTKPDWGMSKQKNILETAKEAV